MSLKSTTVCALAFGATVLAGMAFAESAAEAQDPASSVTPAVPPQDGIQALREQMSAILSRSASATTTQEQLQLLREQIAVIVMRLEELSKKEQEKAKQPEAKVDMPQPPSPPAAKAPTAEAPAAPSFLKGFYGAMDVSGDYVTKGIAGKIATQYTLANPPDVTTLTASVHSPPVGRVGWMPELSTNKSTAGYRGEHTIGSSATKVVYQIEAGISITAGPGLNTSYTQQGDAVKSALGAGDTFIGIANKSWGAIKFGTTYAPYKKATDVMNPFSGQLGDYAAVMGNSGGDNRVEFGTRLDHSFWYESPKFADGMQLDALYSPGQNRTFDNVVQSAGSPDCNGGNMPGSGNLPLNCDDGGFGDAASVDLRYSGHGLYVVAAYEWHKDVNRNSDGIGSNNYLYQIFAFNNPNLVIGPNNNPQGLPASALGAYTTSVGDEWAAKVGLQYKFSFGLTVGGIYEWLRRDIPANLAFQNERSRDGSWVVASQDFGKNGNLAVGWAHAGKTPGDPGGQHNYNPFAPADTANMITAAYRHKLDKNLTIYFDYANTVNHGNVHYDLGAGGRGLTTDCHDGTNTVFTDYSGTGPTTWGGCHIIGASAGLRYTF